MPVAWLVVLLVVAAVAVSFAVRGRDPLRAPALLRQAALLLTAVVAVGMFPAFVADSGAHAIWALGLPVVVAALPLLAARSRVGVVVTAAAAVFLLGWSLVFGLGMGLLWLPAALAETAAAGTQRRVRVP
jgi:hypothetical protein